MQNYTTVIQQMDQLQPTRLEVLSELEKRGGLDQTKHLKSEYLKLKRGFEGEELLVEYLETYGADHWVILRNVWLNFFGGFECDVLLITRAGLYPFEVKNFSGTFVLKDNVGVNNGIRLGKHPITQGLNADISVKAIFKEELLSPKILTSVVFIGADSQVEIHDAVPDLNILVRNQLNDFIWEVKQMERYYQGKYLEAENVIEVLSRHEIPHLYPAENLTAKLRDDIRTGIKCCYCGRFDVTIERKYVTCRCGMHESRDEAIVRTVCEYGVMHFDRNLTTTELAEFIGGSISRSTLYRCLKQYFEKDGTFRDARIINLRLPFSKVYSNFDFPIKKFIIIDTPINP